MEATGLAAAFQACYPYGQANAAAFGGVGPTAPPEYGKGMAMSAANDANQRKVCLNQGRLESLFFSELRRRNLFGTEQKTAGIPKRSTFDSKRRFGRKYSRHFMSSSIGLWSGQFVRTS